MFKSTSKIPALQYFRLELFTYVVLGNFKFLVSFESEIPRCSFRQRYFNSSTFLWCCLFMLYKVVLTFESRLWIKLQMEISQMKVF